METTLIKQTKIYKFSTQSSSGLCLNQDSSYKSSFFYSLPVLNFHEEDIESVYLSVPYVSIPVSFYNIDSYNNKLYIVLSTTPSVFTDSNAFVIELAAGHYNVINFITEFKKASQFLNGGSFSITYDKFTNKFTIVNTDAQYYFRILEKSTISSVIGFSTSLNSIYSTTTAKHSIVMPRVANFLYIPRIHLRCYEIASSHLVSAQNNNCDSNILISVPNDSGANGKINYTNTSNINTLLDIPFLNHLTINFTDEQGNLINFNGISSYFEIQIDIYRRKPVERKPTFRQLIQQLSTILE